MAQRDLIVIGASAGGLEPLRELVASFPADLQAAVIVVMHIAPTAESVLPAILMRSCKLPAERAVDGQKYERGRIYVAPPDRHLAMFDGRLRVTAGPRVNGHRPAVDVLFRSAARWGGPRVMGVVLSGSLNDGAAGLLAIRRAGGITFAQDPSEARYPGMPTEAIQHAAAEHVLPTKMIEQTLLAFVGETVAAPPPVESPEDPADDLEIEPEQRTEIQHAPSSFTCPSCHGALWEVREGELVRYRCRTGHAFQEAVLAGAQSEEVETALWTAYRALQEKAALSARLAARARDTGQTISERRYKEAQEDAHNRATVLHDLLTRGTVGGGTDNG